MPHEYDTLSCLPRIIILSTLVLAASIYARIISALELPPPSVRDTISGCFLIPGLGIEYFILSIATVFLALKSGVYFVTYRKSLRFFLFERTPKVVLFIRDPEGGRGTKPRVSA